MPPASLPGLTTSTRIWNRNARVRMSGRLVAEHVGRGPALQIAFNVTRHNRVEPNRASVELYGLADATRKAIQREFHEARQAILRAGGVGSIGDLVIEAGNDGVLGILSKCDIIDVKDEPLHPGRVLRITAQDGVLPTTKSIVNESIAPGVDLNLAKTVLAGAMQIAFLDADSEEAFTEALSQYSASRPDGGLVLQGPTPKVLTELLEPMKLSWSMQDGKLQLLRFDGTTTDKAVLLSPTSGLTQFEELGDGQATATARLNPLLTPGRQVHVVDELGRPRGEKIYRVDQVDHVGNTDTGGWTSTCSLRSSNLRPTQNPFS